VKIEVRNKTIVNAPNFKIFSVRSSMSLGVNPSLKNDAIIIIGRTVKLAMIKFFFVIRCNTKAVNKRIEEVKPDIMMNFFQIKNRSVFNAYCNICSEIKGLSGNGAEAW